MPCNRIAFCTFSGSRRQFFETGQVLRGQRAVEKLGGIMQVGFLRHAAMLPVEHRLRRLLLAGIEVEPNQPIVKHALA